MRLAKLAVLANSNMKFLMRPLSSNKPATLSTFFTVEHVPPPAAFMRGLCDQSLAGHCGRQYRDPSPARDGKEDQQTGHPVNGIFITCYLLAFCLMKRLLIIVASIVGVLIVAALLVPLFINVDSFRPNLEKSLSTALNRDVHMRRSELPHRARS